MLSGAYVPRWVQVHTVLGAIRAITFVINRAHERYARFLPDDRIAEVIAAAEGFLGPCAEYLINTVDHLARSSACAPRCWRAVQWGQRRDCPWASQTAIVVRISP